MRRKKGQAIVELALVLPVILLLFCAIADFGRVLYASTKLNLVAQEAVRMAGRGRDDNEVRQYVLDNAELKDSNKIDVSITPIYNSRESGHYVTVNVKYNVSYITPIINIFLPSPYQVNVASTIRVE